MQVAVEESSTNDATSSRQSTTNTSFSQNDTTSTNAVPGATAGNAKLNVLTTDGIIKECIKQGFYRNPICNEKLYLHNKGYDVVAPTAFDLYTDVKVLWLEGNALRTLPIGGAYIQTRPPKNKYAFLDEEEEEKEEGEEEAEREQKKETKPEAHVDPMQNINDAIVDEGNRSPSAVDAKKQEKAAQKRIQKELAAAAALLPEAQAIVDEAQKDAFSSLYPTVRQLYLHNNLFRAMPDLHRFQLLDSVHLGNNFFSAVVPFCPFWDQKIEAVVAQLRQEEDTNGEALAAETMRTVTDSLLRHLQQQQQPQRAATSTTEITVQQKEANENNNDNNNNNGTVVLSTDAAEKQRDALLLLYKKLTERCYTICEHAPIALEDDTGALPATIPAAQRCPCSTLRTLNLAQNRLTEFTDVLPLLSYHAVTTLDLSGNQLHDGDGLLLILEKLPRLLSLKLQGNPLTRSLRRYRQQVLSRCKKLVYLDDRPVFEDERRLVTAWAKGGDAAVNKERECIKQENEAKQQKRLDDFRALLANAKNSGEGAHRGSTSNSGEAYIAAVTTDAALAQAAPQQHVDPTGRNEVTYEHGFRIQQARHNERRPNDEERDDSPTSDDEESEEETQGRSATATTEEVHHSDAAHAWAENKPEKQARRTDNRERVLSTNRPATTTTTTTTTNGNDADDSGDDIYIPST